MTTKNNSTTCAGAVASATLCSAARADSSIGLLRQDAGAPFLEFSFDGALRLFQIPHERKTSSQPVRRFAMRADRTSFLDFRSFVEALAGLLGSLTMLRPDALGAPGHEAGAQMVER